MNVVYDVVMRYVFNDVSIAFQEMEWHLFSAVFLLGVPYAIKAGGHVRVDVFYERLSIKAQAIIDLLGTFCFSFPILLIGRLVRYRFCQRKLRARRDLW